MNMTYRARVLSTIDIGGRPHRICLWFAYILPHSDALISLEVAIRP
jgi:hypothetical protein